MFSSSRRERNKKRNSLYTKRRKYWNNSLSSSNISVRRRGSAIPRIGGRVRPKIVRLNQVRPITELNNHNNNSTSSRPVSLVSAKMRNSGCTDCRIWRTRMWTTTIILINGSMIAVSNCREIGRTMIYWIELWSTSTKWLSQCTRNMNFTTQKRSLCTKCRRIRCIK